MLLLTSVHILRLNVDLLLKHMYILQTIRDITDVTYVVVILILHVKFYGYELSLTLLWAAVN